MALPLYFLKHSPLKIRVLTQHRFLRTIKLPNKMSCVFWKIGDAVWHGESMTFEKATKWVEYLGEKYPDREYWVEQ